MDLARRVRLLISRGVVTQVDEAKKLRTLQVSSLDGEVLGQVEHFEGYGLTARPLLGAESMIASVLGNRSHAISPTTPDRRYRPRVLAEGDVALDTHSDAPAAAHASAAHRLALVASGKKILGRGDEIDWKVGDARVQLTTSSLVLSFGSVTITISSGGIAIEGGASVTINGTTVDIQSKGDYKVHKHSGVQTGGGQTGGVV